jgi:hypothetical protein
MEEDKVEKAYGFLRVEKPVLVEFKRIARKNHRTMNGQMTYWVEMYKKEEESVSPQN